MHWADYQASCEAAFRTSRSKFFRDKKGELHFDSYVCFDRAIFNPEHIEITDTTRDFMSRVVSVLPDAEGVGKYVEASRRRAVNQMRDYVLSTPALNLFVTLTVSPEKHDRKDYDSIVRHVGQWLDNRVRRRGLAYVLVPERHKDGAIHFHGFLNSSACRLSNSGLKRDARGNFRADVEPNRKGKVIYNLEDFDIGFTTALRLGSSWDDRRKAVNYCLKYMGKDSEKVGGRWFLHGGVLGKPVYFYGNDRISDTRGEAFDISESLKCKVIYWWDTLGVPPVDCFKTDNNK